MKDHLIKFLGDRESKIVYWAVALLILFCFPLSVLTQTWDYSSVEIVDTGQGRYKAFVIQHPKDKRKVKGYLHLTLVVSPSMLERGIAQVQSGARSGLYPYESALRHLVEAINKYTDIKADFGKRVAMADPELLKVPWVFISSDVFYPTDVELTNLGRYLLNGGFLFLDAGSGIGTRKDINLRNIIRKALAKIGKPCEFRRLSKNHRIFHCYFDFDTVPLAFSAITPRWGGRSSLRYPDYLVGVEVEGRTAVVLCYADIGRTWQGRPAQTNISSQMSSTHYTRSLQFGINTIIYALTQKGSINERILKEKLGD